MFRVSFLKMNIFSQIDGFWQKPPMIFGDEFSTFTTVIEFGWLWFSESPFLNEEVTTEPLKLYEVGTSDCATSVSYDYVPTFYISSVFNVVYNSKP